MSSSSPCKCYDKKTRLLNWRVIDRNCNYSAFNGRKYAYSRYSSITCLKCNGVWRTKANYVNELPDYKRN